MLLILGLSAFGGIAGCVGVMPGEGSDTGETIDVELEFEYVLGFGEGEGSDIGGETVCGSGY
jgi:hypothetical protein